ncbi:unnamed protein product [Darwinula stevensoni]|uniref:Major facilitator superfamily (MFS) profile domain-containing protein n=1 Tax=Darwinula stevensoni TaxID=69355 RepID=A0A7R8ZYV7_9CRUS|nr:unnamed protein product [Darwinula stevensoni]CAG0882286.1 unnamed protein product [Darwinula stevensoni]
MGERRVEGVDPPLQKWQLGMVFIPDSIGYLLGTNCFGAWAYRVGRHQVAAAAMVLTGFCAFMIPSARSVWVLGIPHFGMGLGIGMVDSALMPLLAHLLDLRYTAVYANVYAIAQAAVSLAYSLGPLLGGLTARSWGFPWLMRSVGIMNLVYSPLCFLLQTDHVPEETQPITLKAREEPGSYKTTESISNEALRRYGKLQESDSD